MVAAVENLQDVRKRVHASVAVCLVFDSIADDRTNSAQRAPLSKQRNKHLQTTLIEAAKMAPPTAQRWRCSITGKSKRAMPTVPCWRWPENWWPT
jgi:hypothetical protein